MTRKQKSASRHRDAPVPAAQVRDILRDLARWAVASSVGLSGACSSVHEPGGRDAAGAGGGQAGTDKPTGNAGKGPGPTASWVPYLCAPGTNTPGILNLAELTQRLDFAAVFRSYPFGMGMAEPFPSGTSAIAQTGQPCATASALAQCTAKVDELSEPSADCRSQGSCSSFLLTNVGDVVTRSEERAALVTLLGAIDSPEKAMLIALFEGAFADNDSLCAFSDLGVPDDVKLGTETLATSDGYDLRSTWHMCGVGIYTQTVRVAADGSFEDGVETKIGESRCMVGRRPAGLRATAGPPQRTRIGAFLAGAAHLEAASVFAFERLARELAALGAPSELQAEALRSALDEIRHARVVAALAQRFGGDPQPPQVAALPLRSRFAIALENAIEGCVRETYGALLAEHQAQTASDPEVRTALRGIADDELRHALLAHRVAEWLEPQLSDAERQALAAARTAAVIQLLAELDTGLLPAEMAALGWPSREVAAELIGRMAAALAVA